MRCPLGALAVFLAGAPVWDSPGVADAFSIVRAAAATASNDKLSVTKAVEKLVTKAGGAFYVDDAELYKKIVLAPKRDFDLTVLILAGENYDCKLCVEAEIEYKMYAEELYRAGKMTLADTHQKAAQQEKSKGQTVHDEEEDVDETTVTEKPFIMAMIDATRLGKIAQDFHGLNEVPFLGFLPHDKKLTRGGPVVLAGEEAERKRMQQKSGEGRFWHFTEHTKLSFGKPLGSQYRNQLNTWLGYELEFTMAPHIHAIRAVLFFALLLCLVRLAFWFIGKCRKYPMLMGICALVVYFFSTSGIVWNMINGFHTKGFNQVTGRVEYHWFLWGQRKSQAGWEGFIMATAMLTVSGLFVLAGKLLASPSARPESLQIKSGGSKSRNTRGDKEESSYDRFSSSPLMFVLVIFILILAIGLWCKILDAAQGKSPLTPSFFPPKTFVKGPLRRDRGNTF